MSAVPPDAGEPGEVDAAAVRRIVHDCIGEAWETSNHHGVDLREALLEPELVTLIDRTVLEGEVRDTLMRAWVVLVEDPEEGRGYRVVASPSAQHFGLAEEGFPGDDHLLLCGWYGDFWDAFLGM